MLYCPYFLVPRQAKNGDSTALLESEKAKVLSLFSRLQAGKIRDGTALLQSEEAKVPYCPCVLLAGTNKVPSLNNLKNQSFGNDRGLQGW